MRKVAYYIAGALAEFPVIDQVYEAFASKPAGEGGPGANLEKARNVLERCLKAAAESEGSRIGEAELIAACYIWHYFNTTDEDTRIDGDIIIVDPDGSGQSIVYESLAAVTLEGGED